METSNLNSESLESSITKSWVLLSTNEATNTSDSGEIQSISEKLNGTTDDLLKPSSVEDIQSTIDYTNNKSDAESDGISIISDSEFYQIRSDDDSSTNSSDENSSDNFKTQLEVTKQPQNSLAAPIEKQKLSNSRSPDNKNIEMTREATTSSIISKEKLSKNRPRSKFEGVLFPLHFFLFGGIFVLTLISSCIPSDRKNIKHDLNSMSSDEFQNLDIYEYCEAIQENSYYSRYKTLEKCVGKLIIQLKKAEKIEQLEKDYSNKQRLNHALNIEKTDFIFDKNYDEKDNKQKDCETNNESNVNEKYQLDKNIKKLRSNKFLDNHELKTERNQKQEKISRNNKGHTISSYGYEGSLDEPRMFSNSQLILEKERLEKWKKDLLRMQKLLMERDADVRKKEENLDLYGSCDYRTRQECYPKKKININENRYTYKKNKEYQSNSHKKNSRSHKKEDDKHKIPQNRNSWAVKDKKKQFKTRENKKTKTVVNDKKLKNPKVPYNQKKNQSSVFDDNNTITGEWYINQLQGRNDIRKKEGKARWWFDRANFRKIKRNKAYWYFQYMFNRENLRYEPKVL